MKLKSIEYISNKLLDLHLSPTSDWFALLNDDINNDLTLKGLYQSLKDVDTFTAAISYITDEYGDIVPVEDDETLSIKQKIKGLIDSRIEQIINDHLDLLSLNK